MSRPLRIAGLVSVLLHFVILAVFVWRYLQALETPPPPAAAAVPDVTPTIEMVMVEQKGAGETTTASPSQPPTEQQPPEPPRPEQTAVAPPLPPPPPPAAPPRPALQMNLGGTDSPSNAITVGTAVVPGRLDNKTRNLPPIYPDEAARLHQQGTVVLLIHVGSSGLPSGVDIAQSSGYPLLDRAATDAAMKWAFMPAMKDGLPVPFDFGATFQFSGR